MNPFDLRGPQFLAFYSILSVAVVIVLVLSRRRIELRDAPRLTLSDPYLIAYLRGGRAAAVRVATLSLIDRGLVETKADGTLETKDGSDVERVSHPLEKALIERLTSADEPHRLVRAFEMTAPVEELERTLKRHRLLPDDETQRQRLGLTVFGIGVLWTVALIKIFVALGRGRTNIGFLIVLAIVAAVATAAAVNPRVTARGRAILADLRQLFSHLRSRAALLTPGSATAEAALLAAVFGLAALPTEAFPYAWRLQQSPAAGSSSSSSCGSSGSSCSSCGSSCGGGCGGGCGGCGG